MSVADCGNNCFHISYHKGGFPVFSNLQMSNSFFRSNDPLDQRFLNN